jgi:hypothetical protein
MKKFNSLTEPMKVAYIGAAGTVVAAIIAAIIGGIFLLRSVSPQSPNLPPTVASTTTQPTGTISQTTPTISSSTPVLSRPGTPFLVDPLTGPNSQDQWDVTVLPYVSCGYSNRGYDLKAPANQVGGCSTEAATTILTDFIYEIKMTIISGVTSGTSGTRGAGVMFRYNNQDKASNYGVSFQQDGTYYMFIYNKGVLGATLGAGLCTSFHQGTNQTNLIDIEAQGRTITLFVNNTYVMTTTDNQFQSGLIGVEMGTGTTPAEVVYSDLKVWKL